MKPWPCPAKHQNISSEEMGHDVLYHKSSDEDLCFLGALAEVGGVSDTYEDDEMQFAASLFFTGRVLRFRVAAGMVTQRLQAHAMARINKWFV